MRAFLIGTLATAITFAVVSYVLPQIDYDGQIGNLLVISLIAGVVNGLIKPVIKVLSLPLTIMTLGLFGLILNAGLLLLVAWLSDVIGISFTVGGFPPDFSTETLVTAVLGGIAISIVGSIVSMVVRD